LLKQLLLEIGTPVSPVLYTPNFEAKNPSLNTPCTSVKAKT
jgi:hypothetical protein